MRRSTDRILTTHTGSLPRPPELLEALIRRDRGEPVDAAALDARIADAVTDIVRRQVEAGVSVVNDGEAGKIGYAAYVTERLDGFGGEADPPGPPTDMLEFPEYLAREQGDGHGDPAMPACDGPIAYRDTDAVRTDIANLRAALAGGEAPRPEEAFLSAASPGVVVFFLADRHYGDHERYLFAIADAMKAEYDEIHRAGLLLQLDCPDLALSRHAPGRRGERRGLPPVRPAPRRRDRPRYARHPAGRDADAPVLGQLRGPAPPRRAVARDRRRRLRGAPGGDLLRGGQPAPRARVDRLFEDVRLPDGKVLIPGVLDSTTNYIEHPELIASGSSGTRSSSGPRT